MRLKNKVAIITGGSRGIGFATADKFLKEGASVILTASTQASADKAVQQLKEKYPHLKRVYVRASFQYIDNDYENYLLKSYEETYFPLKIANAGKGAYVERNYEMIDKADVCVFYYDDKNCRQNSGTKIAYEYATRKHKKIINLCENN